MPLDDLGSVGGDEVNFDGLVRFAIAARVMPRLVDPSWSVEIVEWIDQQFPTVAVTSTPAITESRRGVRAMLSIDDYGDGNVFLAFSIGIWDEE